VQENRWAAAAAPQGLCPDKAYDNTEVRDLVADYDLTPHIRARGEEIAEKVLTPGWRARRWSSKPATPG
jgi:putative transposase